MNDDFSILGPVVVYRRIPPIYLNFDTNGLPIMSDGAFRTKELSVRRCDKVTEAEMLKEGDPTDGLAKITIQAIRDAGCIGGVRRAARWAYLRVQKRCARFAYLQFFGSEDGPRRKVG
jgi:hypothetical protein